MSLDSIQSALAVAGFNLTGALPPAEYDARVPEPWRAARVHPDCRGVLVVGNGGRSLWPIFSASLARHLSKPGTDVNHSPPTERAQFP